MKIAPSMLSADFNQLAADIQRIERMGVEYLHIDLMDGQFVPNISFGPMVYAGLRKKSNLVFDCHMMVDRPERYIKSVAEAGADIITIHQEACLHLHSALQQIHQLNKKAGVAINPATSVESIIPILDMVDQVLVMTVNPGFGGQAFIPSTLKKVAQLAKIRNSEDLKFEIEVDGGVNDRTARDCVKSGADVLVAGSYIFNHVDPQQAIDQLRSASDD